MSLKRLRVDTPILATPAASPSPTRSLAWRHSNNRPSVGSHTRSGELARRRRPLQPAPRPKRKQSANRGTSPAARVLTHRSARRFRRTVMFCVEYCDTVMGTSARAVRAAPDTA